MLKSKIEGLLLLLFIIILLEPLPSEHRSTTEETSQITDISLVNISSEVGNVIVRQEISNSFPVFPDTRSTYASSVNDDEPTDGSYSIPLLYVLGIIVATAITTAGITLKKFRKVEIVVVGLDKERVMVIAEQIPSEDMLTHVDDHTFGVVLSYFDQRGGAIPTIITPPLLQDRTQFLIDLSDRSFSAAGFVEEITEEKVAVFDIRLADTRMVCISYTFAFDNPEVRRGRENLNITLLVDPVYGELANIFTPEILPSVRGIRSLIETKAPRETVIDQMVGLRHLVTRIIAAYQKIYGTKRFLGSDSVG